MTPGSTPFSADFWALDPTVTFLNHGSFGACPRAILERQTELRDRFEHEPVRFVDDEWENLFADARSRLGHFLGAQADDLAFLPNATTGVNTVLRSLRFTVGDELLYTSHEYNATRNAIEAAAARCDARAIAVPVPFPLSGPDEVVATILGAVTSRTKLVMLDHLTSPTALILPIGEIVRRLRERGIETLIDGAHGPGAVPLDLDALGAGYYTGNLHKWACAPKGAAFLHVRRDLQAQIRPLVISHGANNPRSDRSRFVFEFQWQGTDDPTAFFCAVEAIEFLGSRFSGGWNELRERNRSLAIEARRLLIDRLGLRSPCPESMLGPMAALPLPDDDGPAPTLPHFLEERLQRRLFEGHRIEVPIMRFPGWPKRVLRVSAQLYNSAPQYVRLAEALAAEGIGQPALAGNAGGAR